MKSLKKVSIFLCLLILTSCYESLDFDQINDHVSKQTVTSALTFFTVKPIQFFDETGVQQYTISDITQFEGLNNQFVRDNLVKIDFNAQIKNEFDRDVSIQVEFLDRNNDVVYSFTPIIVAENELQYTYFEEIEIATNKPILNTKFVRISTSVENTGTQMNPNDISEFVFKSSVTLHIESSF